MNLSEKIMIVSLSISQWSARKYDKKVSYEVELANDAHDAGRFNKLLVDKTELKEIRKYKIQARTFHYFNTLAWGDNGDRVLPAANYFEYLNKFNEIKDNYNQAVERFVKDYENLVQASKERLGKMFQAGDYPSPASIRHKFGMSIAFMPLPDADDFRIALQDEEVETLRDQIRGEITSRLQGSIDEILERVKESVDHIVDRLSDTDAIFRDSLMDNLEGLIDILPKLNFSEDKKITNLVVDLKSLLVAPDDLRADPKLRAKIAKQAKYISKSI